VAPARECRGFTFPGGDGAGHGLAKGDRAIGLALGPGGLARPPRRARPSHIRGDAESAEFDGGACVAGKARLSRRRGK